MKILSAIQLRRLLTGALFTWSQIATSQTALVVPFEHYMHKYCNKFVQIPYGSIGSTIKEMEATNFPLLDFFTTSQCQSERYSENVKSPLLHIIVDDPTAREKFLGIIYKYFFLIKNKPEYFEMAINAKNTKGETLLDYIETLKSTDRTNLPEQIAVFNELIILACKHGGVYSTRATSVRCEASLRKIERS